MGKDPNVARAGVWPHLYLTSLQLLGSASDVHRLLFSYQGLCPIQADMCQ